MSDRREGKGKGGSVNHCREPIISSSSGPRASGGRGGKDSRASLTGFLTSKEGGKGKAMGGIDYLKKGGSTSWGKG